MIITRDISTRITRSKHVFLRENPHLKDLFEKLQELDIRNIDDIKVPKPKRKAYFGSICSYCNAIFDNIIEYMGHYNRCKIKNELKKIMIECEVEWNFNPGTIPYMTFKNHIPMKGYFDKAIPQIIKLLEELE